MIFKIFENNWFKKMLIFEFRLISYSFFVDLILCLITKNFRLLYN